MHTFIEKRKVHSGLILFLETLSQLHGTGLHFKKSLGGSKGVLERFPEIQEQIQIRKQCPETFMQIYLYNTCSHLKSCFHSTKF